MMKHHRYISCMGRRLLAAGLVAAIGLGSYQSASASTLSDAKNKKAEAESELKTVKKNMTEIEQKQAELQKEMDALGGQLVDLLVNMDVLKDELSNKETQLKKVNGELSDAKKDEKTQYNAMKKRIRYMYENQDQSMLNALLGSESMADMLNRVDYVSSVYSFDRKQLQSYQDSVKKVKTLKKKVESEKTELEEMQSEYEKQEQQLESMKEEKQGQMNDFDETLQQAQALASEYKQTIEEQNGVIKQEEERIAREEEARRAAAEAAARQAAEAAARQAAEAQRAAAAAAAATTGGGTSNVSISSNANPSYTTGVSGQDVVNYACQFIGNPYVWGGTSLTNGADCSGFVMSVYANFGIGLPHSSAALRSCGQEVGYANAQPGDLICYSGHVAIYMGNGQIVHAKSKADGITTGSATYRTILAVRRVL
ncbi:MAG: NlpC/P60 family protein [Lachnospiraceae bacterium]